MITGLDDLTHGESELGNKTPFFLAMSNPENPTNSSRTTDLTTQSTNWELELVTSACSGAAALAESKLRGHFKIFQPIVCKNISVSGDSIWIFRVVDWTDRHWIDYIIMR
ncbi:hypothetical protein LguiA_025430 [Lonicera macranthoides]